MARKRLSVIFVILIIFGLIGNVLVFWGIGSTITSGIKSVSDSCGKTYQIEKIFSGNWFCPEETKE